ncbi:MAG: hypothetical protein CR984_05445 [Proteobacteria bacterium]|nr:MAG: hypothetical protein CR984_05445 [Pseudomonadota bacterium]
MAFVELNDHLIDLNQKRFTPNRWNVFFSWPLTALCAPCRLQNRLSSILGNGTAGRASHARKHASRNCMMS